MIIKFRYRKRCPQMRTDQEQRWCRSQLRDMCSMSLKLRRRTAAVSKPSWRPSKRRHRTVCSPVANGGHTCGLLTAKPPHQIIQTTQHCQGPLCGWSCLHTMSCRARVQCHPTWTIALWRADNEQRPEGAYTHEPRPPANTPARILSIGELRELCYSDPQEGATEQADPPLAPKTPR